MENNGFNDASAVATLVNGLNAAAEPGVTYAYVNPTELGSDGFIGTDAITTGLIYKSNEVSIVATDFLVFDDGGQQQNRVTDIALQLRVAQLGCCQSSYGSATPLSASLSAYRTVSGRGRCWPPIDLRSSHTAS